MSDRPNISEEQTGTGNRRDLNPIDPEQVAKAVQNLNARDELHKAHPDALQVANTDEFREWVNAKATRRAAFEHATVSEDYRAGKELLDEYKAEKAQPKQKRANRTPALNTALGSESAGSRDMGTPQTTQYNREELLQKMISDPSWRRAHAQEIALAAANGQVKSGR